MVSDGNLCLFGPHQVTPLLIGRGILGTCAAAWPLEVRVSLHGCCSQIWSRTPRSVWKRETEKTEVEPCDQGNYLEPLMASVCLKQGSPHSQLQQCLCMLGWVWYGLFLERTLKTKGKKWRGRAHHSCNQREDSCVEGLCPSPVDSKSAHSLPDLGTENDALSSVQSVRSGGTTVPEGRDPAPLPLKQPHHTEGWKQNWDT